MKSQIDKGISQTLKVFGDLSNIGDQSLF